MAHRTLHPRSEWPSASARPFFLYETHHPKVLQASMVKYESETQVFAVTCATSCSDIDFPQQTITHISGSSWAGEYSVSGTSSSWGCDLGSGSDDTIPDQYGVCQTGKATSGTEVSLGPKFAVNSCFVAARSVLVNVTAGLDQYYTHFTGTADRPNFETVSPKKFDAWQSAELKSLGCPATTTPGGTSTSATGGAAGPAKTSGAVLSCSVKSLGLLFGSTLFWSMVSL